MRGHYVGRCWIEPLKYSNFDWVHCGTTPRAAYKLVRGIGGRACLFLVRNIWGSSEWYDACREGLW